MSAFSLELQGLTKQFGKTEIIRGVDLQVTAGERVAIIGPNGAGKSTLFNLISGRFAPSAGSISLKGQRIDGLKPFEINRLGLSRSFQITNIFPKLSVFENLELGGITLGLKTTHARLPEVLDFFPRVKERLHSRAASLSGGEQKQLEIGRALLLRRVSRPRVVLKLLGLSPIGSSPRFELDHCTAAFIT